MGLILVDTWLFLEYAVLSSIDIGLFSEYTGLFSEYAGLFENV